MAQGERGRLIELVLAWTLIHGTCKERHQRCVGQLVDVFPAVTLLGIPVGGIFPASTHTLALDALVKHAFLQFQKETRHAVLPVGQLVHAESLTLQRVEKLVTHFLHAFQCRIAECFQLLGILLQESLLGHDVAECRAVALVVVTKDGLAKLLHLSDDVPRVVVADGFHDVVEQPLQHVVGMCQRVYETVYGQFFHLIVIQADAQIGRQVEFACQVA